MKRLLSVLISLFFAGFLLQAKGVVSHGNVNADSATLKGHVWWDKNLDGIQDENMQGIAGIRVHLYKNGEDTGEMVLTQTMGEGNYTFTNLDPNAKYSVKIDLPKNYPDFTLQNKGNDAAKDSDIVNWPWRSESVYLKAGDVGVLDAGLICKYCSQIHLEKYTNGILVDEPSKIPYIKVGDKVTWTYKVYNDSTKVTIKNIKVTDDKEGSIDCPQSSLEPGASMECTKTGVAKEGAYKNMGTVTGEAPDKNVTDEYPSNYYGAVAKIDIEKYTNGSDSDNAPGKTLYIGKQVTWKYVVKNTGNIPLENVKVTDNKEGAVSCPKNTLDVGESMTCTKTGIVKEGQYENEATVMAENEKVGKTQDSDKSHYKGVYEVACLGDRLWYDKNLNGIQDSGEPGVINIGISLYDASGTKLASTHTDSNGNYKFCNLKPGQYKVKFDQPNTYLFTLQNKGDDSKDSDVDNQGWSQTVTLKGRDNMTIDAGIYCECDDAEVHPNQYKKVSAAFSPFGVFGLLIFIYIATLTVRQKER